LIAKSFEEVLNYLINVYREDYPHNPEGVLRFHLEKLARDHELNLVEVFIRLAYENGIRIELVEALRVSGLDFNEAVKEASIKLRMWEEKLKKQFSVRV